MDKAIGWWVYTHKGDDYFFLGPKEPPKLKDERHRHRVDKSSSQYAAIKARKDFDASWRLAGELKQHTGVYKRRFEYFACEVPK